MLIAGVRVTGTVVGSLSLAVLPDSSERSVTAGPVGGVPRAVAWLTTKPVSIFAWVSTSRAVIVVLFIPAGASVAIGPPVITRPTKGSVTDTLVSVTFPVLVIAKV